MILTKSHDTGTSQYTKQSHSNHTQHAIPRLWNTNLLFLGFYARVHFTNNFSFIMQFSGNTLFVLIGVVNSTSVDIKFFTYEDSCHEMWQNLKWSDGQEQNRSKSAFLSELNHEFGDLEIIFFDQMMSFKMGNTISKNMVVQLYFDWLAVATNASHSVSQNLIFRRVAVIWIKWYHTRVVVPVMDTRLSADIQGTQLSCTSQVSWRMYTL